MSDSKKVLILHSMVNQDICNTLKETASEYLRLKKLAYDCVSVPGAFEIPAALNFISSRNSYIGYILLGCIVKSGTPHFDYVASEACSGITSVVLKRNLCVGFGIITANNMEQAIERAEKYAVGAAEACIRMIQIKEQFCVDK